MNKFIINTGIAMLVLAMILPIAGMSQEKEVRMKTVKIVNGEKIVTDTTYTVNEGDEDITSTMSWVMDTDSLGTVTMDIDMDIDTQNGKQIFIVTKGSDGSVVTSHGDKEMKYVIKIEEDGDGEHKVVVIENDSEFIFDGIDIHKFHDEMKELKTMRIELDGERIVLLEELGELSALVELKELEALSELSELQNIVIDIPDMPDFHNYHKFEFHDNHSNVVTDKELRDAGIRNKVDRLDVSNIDINIDNGVVDLEFKLGSEGTPKIIVYNYFGDKVFTGKPELMGGEYTIKIDLSKKQHGTYYLQIIQKDASLTEKLML
ncbi:MAG: hypothetical protein QM503_14730 [Bacteroidota bacterium]